MEACFNPLLWRRERFCRHCRLFSAIWRSCWVNWGRKSDDVFSLPVRVHDMILVRSLLRILRLSPFDKKWICCSEILTTSSSLIMSQSSVFSVLKRSFSWSFLKLITKPAIFCRLLDADWSSTTTWLARLLMPDGRHGNAWLMRPISSFVFPSSIMNPWLLISQA